jgi:uncharacterized OsmC-like protein
MYEVSASIVAPGVSELTAKAERVRFDSSPGAGDELPGPAELLCGALAACLLKNVERFSQMLRFSQQGASVRVVAERQDAPPMFTRIRYELRVVTDEPPQRLLLLQRNLAKYGTVYNTLSRVCDIDGEVNAVPPDWAATPATAGMTAPDVSPAA